jgi:hypothetical protein
MSDWTAGYVADVGYTFGYYPELNPQRIKLAFLGAGLIPPDIGTACELGFGQGISINHHAAASVIKWQATDFNPSQAAFAQEFANATQANVRLYDDAFADFCTRPDLPDFDYIGLHGIWSWVSDDNRKIIVEFIRKKLKVGGVVYMSYNALPGWAAPSPLRHLIMQHAVTLGGSDAGMHDKIDGALAFANQLMAVNPLFLRANPVIADKLKQLHGHNKNYLAHEYFNANWESMYFSEIAEWLNGAKLDFACSADMLQQLEPIIFNAEQLTFLNGIPSPVLRETARDYIMNLQFRKDYWVKGARRYESLDLINAVRSLRVVLTIHRGDVRLTTMGPMGEISMNPDLYEPLLDVMSDHKVHSIGQLEKLITKVTLSHSQILQMIMVLSGAGYVYVAQDEQFVAKSKKQTDQANLYLLNKAKNNGALLHLCSPVIGGGISVGWFAQLFLLARSKGHTTPAQWASFAWNILQGLGQNVLKDGVALVSAEDNLTELTRIANLFSEKHMPVLKALQVI